MLLPLIFVVDRRRAARARHDPVYAAKRADATFLFVGHRVVLMVPLLAIVAALSAIKGDWQAAAVSLLGSVLAVLVLLHLRRKAQVARRAAAVVSDRDYNGLDFHDRAF